MSGNSLFSRPVFISLASLLVIQLSLALFLPRDPDNHFCDDKHDGNYEYPAPNCSLFYTCSNQITSVQQCAPENLYFDQVKGYCDWPDSFSDEKQYDCKGTQVEDRTTRFPISSTTSEASAQEPTDSGPSGDTFCNEKEDGTYEYPADCGKFYHCSNELTYVKDCQPGLYFNQSGNACDYADLFPEDKQAQCQGLTTGVSF